MNSYNGVFQKVFYPPCWDATTKFLEIYFFTSTFTFLPQYLFFYSLTHIRYQRIHEKVVSRKNTFSFLRIYTKCLLINLFTNPKKNQLWWKKQISILANSFVIVCHTQIVVLFLRLSIISKTSTTPLILRYFIV